MTDVPSADPPVTLPATAWKQAQRLRCLNERAAFAASAAFGPAQAAVREVLKALLDQLEPEGLGLYWPVRGEFSPGVQPFEPLWPPGVPVALPCANKLTGDGAGQMVYRRWQGPQADGRDPCGLPTAHGPVVAPDVLLVPCVAFTASGWRLGYGGGYFDRYLTAHPSVTTIGVAYSGHQLPEQGPDAWPVSAHDRALTLVVTERGVVRA